MASDPTPFVMLSRLTTASASTAMRCPPSELHTERRQRLAFLVNGTCVFTLGLDHGEPIQQRV